MKFYAGIDIHKDSFFGTVLDNSGRVIEQGNFPNTKEALQRFLFTPCKDTSITIEACGLWRGFYKMLKDSGYDALLADPRKVKQISGKKKTDKEDSQILADLLRTGYLPVVYIPDEEIIDLRNTGRHRVRLVHMRAALKCRIKWMLLRSGIKYKRKLWNKEGIAWLKTQGFEICNYVQMLELLNSQVRSVDKTIRTMNMSRKNSVLLQSIPGIGRFGSLLIEAEIGNICRFPDPKSLVSYAGLCPGIYQSGEKSRTVASKACNKYLKWIMYECSGRAIMMQTKYMKHYYHVRQKKGKQIARRSTARKMLSDVWYIMSKELPYES